VTTAQKAVPQLEFQKCFQQWQHPWAKCKPAQGEYFESDSSQLAVSIQVSAIKSVRELHSHTSYMYTSVFDPALGPTRTPIQWVQGVLCRGIKRPEREADLTCI
jgi:hypothetical protein